MNKNFYIGLIEATEKKEAFVQVFYATANHIGEAIDIMLNYAKQIDLKNPNITEVDTFEFETLPDEAIKSDEFDTYCIDKRHYFPQCDYLKFQLPYGVVLSCVEGKFDSELISEGCTRYKDNNGIEHLEIVVDRTRLLDIYLKIVEKLKSIQVLWLRISKDWENSDIIEFYSNEELNNLFIIRKFILGNMNDIFLNGYLSITVYSNDSATNVCIDDHKKILITTKSNEFIDMISTYIKDIGFKYYKNDDFYSIDYGYYHWHYRPANSKNRKDLIKHLMNNGFSLWRTE